MLMLEGEAIEWGGEEGEGEKGNGGYGAVDGKGE